VRVAFELQNKRQNAQPITGGLPSVLFRGGTMAGVTPLKVRASLTVGTSRPIVSSGVLTKYKINAHYRINFILVLVAVLLITTGCDKDDVMPKQMTISFLCEEDFTLALVGIGIAIIDWGDSSTDTVSLPDCSIGEGGALYITHIYSELSTDHITIKITGENITDLVLFNYLTNLDVSRNKALKELLCSGIQLTNLNVSKNIKLDGILIMGNQFTTAALNALFETLCNTAKGTIYIGNNPGTADCDRSIAEKKGWWFNG